ncbi:MAG: type II secretion system GspH family protein [Clostridiales bacterium]|nr:type II secretion system GspH family protein [Clostridiales bacterium]
MLKLRKNKKGFTLVELIVVIAIMAVLAGTVAGVTVTQLNKNTDKTNYTQANKIATTISGLILESPEKYIDVAAGSAAADTTTTQQDTFKTDEDTVNALIKELDSEFSGKGISNTNKPAKGKFGVYISQDKSLIVVCFGAKTNDYKERGYKITINGVVQEITGETNNKLPAAFTTTNESENDSTNKT